MKKLLITSAAQLALLLNNNPALLTVPAFASLRNLVQHIQSQPVKSNCNCGAKVNPYIQLRPQMETALASMTPADFETMKSLLKVDQICYYKQDATGKLTQLCL